MKRIHKNFASWLVRRECPDSSHYIWTTLTKELTKQRRIPPSLLRKPQDVYDNLCMYGYIEPDSVNAKSLNELANLHQRELYDYEINKPEPLGFVDLFEQLLGAVAK